MINKELKQFGLNEKEVDVYLAILELGEANISQISKKSKVKRTTVYDVLESLEEKGLISKTKHNKKVLFLAENPKEIENKLEERKQRFVRMLPELLSIANSLPEKPKIKYYEGDNGLKEVYLDILKFKEQKLLAWVAEEALEVFDVDFLNNYYLPKRLENRIWLNAIAPDLPIMQKYKGDDVPSLRVTKLIDAKRFPLDVEINLYGKNKIGIISFEEKIGIIIESEKIFITLKSIFELQWESLSR